jgi:peptide chain release factor 1
MEVGSDYQRAAELGIERAELEPVVLKARQYQQVLERIDEARSLQDGADEEMRLLAEAEIAELSPQTEELEHEIKAMLLPKDARDQRSVIVEIRAGTGGD